MRHRRHRRRNNPVGRLVGGLVLIVVGLAFTLDNFDLVEWQVAQFWKFWPVLLIVIGIAKLANREERTSGLWLVGLGTWFQMVTLRVWGMDWENAWPVLLIMIGGILVTQTILDRMGLMVDNKVGCHDQG